MTSRNFVCKCGKGFDYKADYQAHRLKCDYLAPYEREPIVAPVLPIKTEAALTMTLEAAQAAQADAIQDARANGDERDALASVVTAQRSQIDLLRAENETLRAHASQRLLDVLDGPKICPVCHNQGGDLEDSSKPCYECGR